MKIEEIEKIVEQKIAENRFGDISPEEMILVIGKQMQSAGEDILSDEPAEAAMTMEDLGYVVGHWIESRSEEDNFPVAEDT